MFRKKLKTTGGAAQVFSVISSVESRAKVNTQSDTPDEAQVSDISALIKVYFLFMYSLTKSINSLASE